MLIQILLFSLLMNICEYLIIGDFYRTWQERELVGDLNLKLLVGCRDVSFLKVNHGHLKIVSSFPTGSFSFKG